MCLLMFVVVCYVVRIPPVLLSYSCTLNGKEETRYGLPDMIRVIFLFNKGSSWEWTRIQMEANDCVSWYVPFMCLVLG